ncbi:MAG: hypothetical protein ABIO70_04365 [Pseudomonadota bacterium]
MLPILLLLACTPKDADVAPDTGACGDAGLVAPAAEGRFFADGLLSDQGVGEGRLQAFEVSAGAASLTLAGVAHRGLLYADHDWQAAGYHLFDLLTVAEDGGDLGVTYLYAQGDDIPYAYTESYTHLLDWESTSGEATWQEGETPVEVVVPALRAAPAPWESGLSIQGDDLWLAGAEGGITVDGTPWALHPFSSVDCGDCPGGPWLEVHSLLVGACEACFGIVYLFPDDPGYAQLSWGLCLPSLTPLEASFDVSWSGSLATSRAARPGAEAPWPGHPPRSRP